MEVQLDVLFKNLYTTEEIDYSNIKQCVKNIIHDVGYVKYSVDKKVYTPDGGSFLGVLCELNIKGQTDRGDTETNLFLKIMTPGEQITVINLPNAYKKEQYAYNELSKIYNELQHEANIPHEERYKFVKSYGENITNAIILQNMRKKGYKTLYRKDTMTLQYTELAVTQLAKFHALSFVLEVRRPGYYERKIKSMTQPINLDEDWSGYIQNVCQVALDHLDGERRKKFEAFVPKIEEKFERYMVINNGRGALCHGDYRINNILVKEEDGDVKDLIPIDYQLIYFGCPVIDFLYLIYPSTDREFRKAHLDHLKETYYDTLTTFLNRFDLDVANIYPKHEFEVQLEERLDYGMMISVNLLPFLMGNDEVPDIATEPIAGVNFCLDEKYKERLFGVIDDFIDNERL